jgi:hypothetical protein
MRSGLPARTNLLSFCANRAAVREMRLGSSHASRWLVLSDVQSPTLSIVCEPCGRRGRYSMAKLIFGARRREADGPSSGARRLPEGELDQHPRPVQGGLRVGAAVGDPAGSQKQKDGRWEQGPADVLG